MLTCLLIAFVLTPIIIALVGGASSISETNKKWNREQLWEDQKTNIDPITGDYTKKGTSLRFDKYGIMKGSE